MVFDEYGKKNQQYEEKTAGVDLQNGRKFLFLNIIL